MIALLALVITLTVPSESDAAYIAALACGEACGMGREPLELIIANLLYDYSEHGTGWLSTRWYAMPRPNAKIEALVWSVMDGLSWPRCRLIGSANDAVYWRENWYVEGEPDLTWSAGEYQVNAFGCRTVRVVFAPMGCTGALCPQ